MPGRYVICPNKTQNETFKYILHFSIFTMAVIKTIKVSPETWYKLTRLKLELNYSTLDEVIEHFIPKEEKTAETRKNGQSNISKNSRKSK